MKIPQAMKFWNMKKTANNSAELMLYGTISEDSWWGDEITPAQFAEDLAAFGDVEEINVHINSGGGDVFAGMAIHSMLKRHAAKVNCYIDGLAASIASIVAMAGDKVIMPKGSMMMIHNPWTFTWGNSTEIRGVADVLDSIRDALVEVYQEKTKLDADEIKELMENETWLTSTQAIEKGFADEHDATPIAAAMRNGMAFFNGIGFDFSKFSNAPKLPEIQKEPELSQAKNKEEGKVVKLMDLEQLKNEYPDLFKAALQEGIEKERERMKALDELAVPGSEELIAKAKYETGATAEATAMNIIKAEKERKKKIIDGVKADAESSGVNDVTASDVDPFAEKDVAKDKEAKEAGSMIANLINKNRGGVK